MQALDQKYLTRLEEIKEEIQASEELAQYLAEEEEEDYGKLQDKYEKRINEVYEEVAAKDPLQLFSLEEHLIDPSFEGLFFPRLMGYAVLRGDLNEQYKYVRPQSHFQKILLAICNSLYFDIVKKRVGQAIQIGFALSSDIWITNLVDEIQNKNVRQFLMSQKLDKYRTLKDRAAGYQRFKRQFQTINFQSTEFPTNAAEMATGFGSLRNFLEYRIASNSDHVSYLDEVLKVLENPDIPPSKNYVHLLGLVANFIDFTGDQHTRLAKVLNRERKSNAQFSEQYFDLLRDLLKSKLTFTASNDARVFNLLDQSISDDLQVYYEGMSIVERKGFVHEDALEAVKQLYNKYDGLSTINDCLRHSIRLQLTKVLSNLSEAEYEDYFELNKTFVAYMDIFDYQQFNQSLKEESIKYVRKLLKKYTDKRGRDYQDIKKFVIPTFQDFGFMKEKEVMEMFKTRRKKKASTAS